jgi:glycerophosphoryl diester phosphodiesterase
LLRGTGETIPRLEEILSLVSGRVPLLIEVKAPEALVGRLCLAVRRALEGYRGPVAVMSFNPQVGRWFADHAPRITRGLVVTEEDKRGMRGRIERHLSLWRARPDFLAYDIRDLPSRFAAAQRARGLPVLTWTVRGAEAEAIAADHADGPIYEIEPDEI